MISPDQDALFRAKHVGPHCGHCGAHFLKRRPSNRFCSKRCASLAQNAIRMASGEPSARYWSNVAKGGSSDCWNWLAGTCEGYGRIRFFGEALGSHVVAYRLAYGNVPEGKMVLHRCGNRLCCNPDHLYAGSHSQNTSDAVGHGTHVCNFGKGEDHISAQLTAEQIFEVRSAIARGETQRSIAARLGVVQQTISAINLGKTWGHVR